MPTCLVIWLCWLRGPKFLSFHQAIDRVGGYPATKRGVDRDGAVGEVVGSQREGGARCSLEGGQRAGEFENGERRVVCESTHKG
jgi:hypothetical protein